MVYEKVKSKSELVKSGSQIEEIKNIGKIENAVTNYFLKEKKKIQPIILNGNIY